jgi:hypothetical protein
LERTEFPLDAVRELLHPTADDEAIERLLQEWLLDRPGAESGDCSGSPVDLDTRTA